MRLCLYIPHGGEKVETITGSIETKNKCSSQLIQMNGTFPRFSFLCVFPLQDPNNGLNAPFHFSGSNTGLVQRTKRLLIKAGGGFWDMGT